MLETVSQPNIFMEDVCAKLLRWEMRLSYSALSAFKESPSAFVAYKTRTRETTPAMIFGSMVHCLILEPEDFDNRYFTFDDSEKVNEIVGGNPRNTKAYKEWKAAACAAAGDRTVVSPEDFRNAKAIAFNVTTNRAAAKILRMCPVREKGIEWEYKNFKFHGFIDLDGEEVTADLKVCADASPKKFQRTIIDMDYHMQGSMYQMGNDRPKKHYIIAADRTGGVSVHLLHDVLIQKGMEEYDRLVGKFNECILSEAWGESYEFYSDRYDGTFLCEAPNWLF